MRNVIFVMAMAVGTVAQAQDVPRPMVSPECRTEMQNLCPATDDRQARRSCMMAKRDTLSPKCKDEIAAMQARRAAGGERGPRPEGGLAHGMGGMSGMGEMNGGNDQGADQGAGSPQ